MCRHWYGPAYWFRIMNVASLHDLILRLIGEDRWGLSWHANETIQERMVEIWQVVGLTPEGRLLREVSDAAPRPKVEIEIMLPDGTLGKAVWVYDKHVKRAILVTVHFFDKGEA